MLQHLAFPRKRILLFYLQTRLSQDYEPRFLRAEALNQKLLRMLIKK